MGLWKWLFGRRKQQAIPEEEWDQAACERDKVNMHDQTERERYLTSCLEQMAEAEKEIGLLTGEYSLVTSYLTDMEEIEALPEEEAGGLKAIARRILMLDKECISFMAESRKMTEEEYKKIQSQEADIPDGIIKLKEAEKYQKLIRQDLSRLDGERHAYYYRRNELNTIMANLKGMATICLTALGACLCMLLILQFGFGMDTFLGYFIAAVSAAVAVTVIYVKYSDASREVTKVQKAVNKLILLQNKVKIRYVNNVNLLDYLYMKYSVDNCSKLEAAWAKYQEEKELRRQYAEAEAKLEYNQKQLVEYLMRFRIQNPGRWTRQAGAIVDRKEMVEIRHTFIERRQALRRQIDYNKEVAQTAQSEVKDIVRLYPQYGNEVTQLVERYEREFKGSY